MLKKPTPPLKNQKYKMISTLAAALLIAAATASAKADTTSPRNQEPARITQTLELRGAEATSFRNSHKMQSIEFAQNEPHVSIQSKAYWRSESGATQATCITAQYKLRGVRFDVSKNERDAENVCWIQTLSPSK